MEGTVALGSVCTCYVDGEQARLATESSPDPRPCLDFCRLQFMGSVVPGWNDGSRYHDGCQNLTGTLQSTRLWPLYWCDSIFCGVAIEQGGGLQQDPNVGRIINTCQNIGSHSVYDPGPPPPAYTCATDLSEAAACTLAGVRVPQATGSASHSPEPTLISSAFPSESFRAATVTQAEPKTRVATPSHSKESSSVSSTRLSSAGAGGPATSGSGLSTGAKIAIGVCSGLALVALTALSLFCLYRRKRRKSSRHHSLRSHLGRESDVPPSGSPTPLIPTLYSGSKGGEAPLTPPLRLRERRFLPSILRPGSRSSSPPLTPLEPAFNPGGNHNGVFPSSPICSPTTNKLIPRNEEKPRGHGGSFSSLTKPPQATLSGGPPTVGTNRSSLGGVSNQSSLRNEVVATPKTSTTGTQMTPSITALGGGPTTTRTRTITPPSSPTRPPRPHDTPLEIPDLVTPAAAPVGPPPSRALPPPPPPPPVLLPLGNTASFSAVGGRTLIPRGVTVIRNSDTTTTTGGGEDSGSEYGYEAGGEGGNGQEVETRASWGSWAPKTGKGAKGGGGQGMGRAY